MRKAFFSVAASNLAGAGLGFLINVLLARLLDVASFGRINLVFSLIMIFYTVTEFGFGNSAVIFYNRHRDDKGADSISVVNFIYLRFLLLVTVLSFLVMLFLSKLYALSSLEITVVFVSFVMFGAYRYLCAIHQAVGNWAQFNILTLSNNILKALCIAIALVVLSVWLGIENYYNSVIYGYIVYSVLLLLIALIATKSFMVLPKNVNKDEIKEYIKILTPIGIAGVFIIITMRFDSLIIEKWLGSGPLGIYSAANSLAMVFPIITGSLMNVVLRESAGDKALFLEKVLTNQKKYLMTLLLVMATSYILSDFIIGVLFGSTYADAVAIFKVLLIAYIGGVFFTPLESYFYANHPNVILAMRFVQMITLILLSVSLIGKFGILGIAYSVVLTRIIAWVFFYIKSHQIRNRGYA